MKYYELEFEDKEEWENDLRLKLYSARWIWRQEYKVFLFFADCQNEATHKARRFVGEGGRLTVEEVEFDSLRGIAVLMED